MNKGTNNLDSAKQKIEIIPYCPLDISRSTSASSALSKPFHIAELSTSKKIHVHIRAYVDFLGGYAEHGRRVLFGLEDSGQCCVKLAPIPSPIDIDPFTMQRCTSLTRNPGFNQKESIFLCIAGPGWAQDKFIPKERYNIAWTMIESMSAHPDIKGWLENANEVWLPTDVDVQRFSTLNLKNVHRMRLGYDENRYYPNIQRLNIPVLDGRYVFGVVGSWNERKNIKAIIRAFCHAYTSRDNVSLLLICKYGNRPYDGMKDGEHVSKDDPSKWDINHEFKRYTEGFTDLPHITLIDIPIHENVMPNLCSNIDCLVGFSMGESTWLPGLDFFGMGKPVIQLASQTNGCMDYMNESNSYLCHKVEYFMANEELYKGTSDYYKGQQFARGDEYELSKVMKKVFAEACTDIQELKCRRALETVKHWTWQKSITDVIKRLSEIKGK